MLKKLTVVAVAVVVFVISAYLYKQRASTQTPQTFVAEAEVYDYEDDYEDAVGVLPAPESPAKTDRHLELAEKTAYQHDQIAVTGSSIADKNSVFKLPTTTPQPPQPLTVDRYRQQLVERIDSSLELPFEQKPERQAGDSYRGAVLTDAEKEAFAPLGIFSGDDLAEFFRSGGPSPPVEPGHYAKEQLAKFDAMSPEEQSAFIYILNDPVLASEYTQLHIAGPASGEIGGIPYTRVETTTSTTTIINGLKVAINNQSTDIKLHPPAGVPAE